jgi:molybdopterin synthase sulfur carrier subunit
MTMKSVKLSYYAVLREKAGRSDEERQTTAETYRVLYDELREQYKFPLDASRVRVAIGDAYVDMEETLVDGADITFIPPVAGG